MKNWKENYDLVTTFALGEATPEQSAQLEEQMKNDPELRAEVEEIRRMGDFLTDALTHEPLPENVEYPSVVILSANENSPKKSWSWLMRTIVCVCSLLLIAAVGVLFWPSVYFPVKMAMDGRCLGILDSNAEVSMDSADKSKDVFYKEDFSKELATNKAAEEAALLSENFEASRTTALDPPAEVEAEAPAAEVPTPSVTAEEQVAVEKVKVFDAKADVAGDDDDEAEEDMEVAEEAAAPEEKTGFWSSAAQAAKNGMHKAVEAPRQFFRRENVMAPKEASPVSSPNLGVDRMIASPAPESYIFPVPLPKPVPAPEPERFITPPQNRNSFSMLEEQKFQKPEENPFSTFGVDVDTASYTLMRQFLTEQGRKPPKESVRVEEYINYFKYDLKGPAEDSDCPFETTVEIQKHPWREGLYMAMVALKGREIPEDKRPKLNLVFLLDVSGSMSDWNKLPLVKDGMMKLLDQLKPEDHVSIVTYANGTDIKLEPTPGTEKGKIEKAILELHAYGGTNGGEGIQRAYELARKNFDKEAENRVVLCTDGDFNVGMTDISELQNLIESEAKSGVFLTVLGFGMGNFQDDRMKSLASHGNGVYGYIDSRAEAKKMLCDGLSGSMITIAKDVKLQIDFNPAKVAAYRLVGYETRHLEAKDFHDDRKDSGDLGAGHSVVALYELVPVGAEIPQSEQVDESRYTPKSEDSAAEPKKEEAKPVNDSPEWFFVKLRWKQPNENESTLKTFPVEFKEQPVSQNFQWASGTALFAMLLRESAYTGTASFDTVLEMIHPAIGESDQRKEFEELVKKAK